MGKLIAWHYPTLLALKLADHTYVTCGNGAARWKCWGGDTGGNALRTGSGSTERANVIAEPDERAGITCYLINGVCHQAANRILFPAKITVRSAKGYYISEALYGTYGRSRGFLGMCNAPFNQHSTITGDLPECQVDKTELSDDELISLLKLEDASDESKEFQQYLSRVRSLYQEADVKTLDNDFDQSKEFQLKLFEELVVFKLTSSFMNTKDASQLIEIRSTIEDKRYPIEKSFQENEMGTDEFLEIYNTLTVDFQNDLANTLSGDHYYKLFELEPDEVIHLGDPDIIKNAYNKE